MEIFLSDAHLDRLEEFEESLFQVKLTYDELLLRADLDYIDAWVRPFLRHALPHSKLRTPSSRGLMLVHKSEEKPTLGVWTHSFDEKLTTDAILEDFSFWQALPLTLIESLELMGTVFKRGVMKPGQQVGVLEKIFGIAKQHFAIFSEENGRRKLKLVRVDQWKPGTLFPVLQPPAPE